MSKYTAEQVQKASNAFAEHFKFSEGHSFDIGPMLNELARRLRQEEEENRRDPVTDPMKGDRIEFANGNTHVWGNGMDVIRLNEWMILCKRPGATIIRRREAQ